MHGQRENKVFLVHTLAPRHTKNNKILMHTEMLKSTPPPVFEKTLLCSPLDHFSQGGIQSLSKGERKNWRESKFIEGMVEILGRKNSAILFLPPPLKTVLLLQHIEESGTEYIHLLSWAYP